MHLSRPTGPRAAISLVAMIDVLMILLVFFMVTSTYLDLDMVPLAGADDSAAAPVVPQTPPMRLLVRLGAEGAAHVRGQVVDAATLGALVKAALVSDPALEVLVLPSGQADVQALASLMDALIAGGAQRLRIIRLEAQP